MSDASTTPLTPAAPETTAVSSSLRSLRSRGLINQGLINELELADQIAATASKPEYADLLAEEHIDTAFLEGFLARINEADELVGTASGKSADKRVVTRSEEVLKKRLLAEVQKVQARAKRKYKAPRNPMRDKYFIGQRLGNRALIERATRAILQALAEDPLPGHKPADSTALLAALDAYMKIQLDQTSDQASATTHRAVLEQKVKAVSALRREIQYAAEILWPAADKANAGTRRAFGLPPGKTLR